MIKVNLQHFAEPVTETVEETTDTTETTLKTQTPGRMFNQDEVNAYVARESKKSLEKALKELGVEDFKSAKDGLSKLRADQESQKSEYQKMKELADTLTKQIADKDVEIQSHTLKTSLLSAGVRADKMKIALASVSQYDGDTMDDKVQAFITDNPELVVVAEQKPVTNFSKPRASGVPDKKSIDEILDERWKNIQQI